MADRPAVRTVPNVELFRTGTWDASTGPVTWGTDDLMAAKAAFDDPGYTRPVVKIGHTDPRFDGQPTLGRIANPRLSDDGQTFIGDLVSVPTWLADILEDTDAFPSRSIEGTFGLETGTGTRHQFALTAVSLLGITAPAVSTLADVATLYGMDPVEVAAAAAHSLEDDVPQTVAVSAGTTVRAGSVSVDKVRQAFYMGPAAQSLPAWSFVVDVRVGTDGEPSVIIVDDDEGNLWSIPWTADSEADTVTFDTEGKTRKRIEYVDAPEVAASGGRSGAMRARLAHLAGQTTTPPDPAPVAAGGPTESQEAVVDDTTMAGLRTRLGTAADADEATVLAALDEALAERAEPDADPGGAPPPAPDGFTLVDNDTLGTLQTAAARGVEAHQRFMLQDRDTLIKAAVADGRIARASVTRWTERWDAEAKAGNSDAADTRATLEALPKGLVPVDPAGDAGQPVTASGDDSVYAALWGDDGSREVISRG